jgi:hypothetical protein
VNIHNDKSYNVNIVNQQIPKINYDERKQERIPTGNYNKGMWKDNKVLSGYAS